MKSSDTGCKKKKEQLVPCGQHTQKDIQVMWNQPGALWLQLPFCSHFFLMGRIQNLEYYKLLVKQRSRHDLVHKLTLKVCKIRTKRLASESELALLQSSSYSYHEKKELETVLCLHISLHIPHVTSILFFKPRLHWSDILMDFWDQRCKHIVEFHLLRLCSSNKAFVFSGVYVLFLWS